MKVISFSVSLCLITVLSFGQARLSLSTYDSLMRSPKRLVPLPTFPPVSCDTLYELLKSYVQQSVSIVKDRGLSALTQLYRDSMSQCGRVRVQLPKDFLSYIQVDSLRRFDSALIEMGSYISKEDVAKLGGRAIILAVYQTKGYRTPFSPFIIPYKMIEFAPLIKKTFNSISINENGGRAKTSILTRLVRLGDSEGLRIYQQTLWNYTKDTTKTVKDLYFKQLLESIRLTQNKELVQQLFEILEYVQSHPNKLINLGHDSSEEEDNYISLGEWIFRNTLCSVVANLPPGYCRSYPPKPYTPEEVTRLIKWSKSTSLQYLFVN